jgi:hypothetical protein
MSLDNPIASAENEKIAARIASAFGCTPNSEVYPNSTGDPEIRILFCPERPVKGVSAYGTLGLSDHPMIGPEGEFAVRLELVGVCANATPGFGRLLAEAAYCVIKTGGVFSPGVVISNYVRRLVNSSPMQHLYLTEPFLWEEQLAPLDCGSKKVAWLLAMPISDAEYIYRKQHGNEALELLFEQRKIDIFNVNRPSVL